jgi:hypothetical protein
VAFSIRALPASLLALQLALHASAPGAGALEKATSRLPNAGRDEGWRAATTCSISYYNVCTGWVWTWSGWSPGDRVGVVFDTCCPGGRFLQSTGLYASVGAPSGYGFTGTIAVHDADAAGCPGGALSASQPFLPAAGWNAFGWNVTVPSRFAVVATHGPGAQNPAAYPSDHPEAGPTGPAACGTCYPTGRAAHSFYYGTIASPLCPGVAVEDGLCAAELLADAITSCSVTSAGGSLSADSWARVKSLYR